MSKRKTLPPDLRRPRPDVKPHSAEWKAWVREIEQYLGYRVCGHKTRKNTPCAKEPAPGRERCRGKSGRSVMGPQHPRWKDGRTSRVYKILPEAMREIYGEIIEDPKLLALESDIALADMRQLELLKRLTAEGDPWGALAKAREALANVRLAMAEGGHDDIDAAMVQLEEALEAEVDDRALYSEWMTVGEHKRKLMESEGKRLERMGQFMTAEQVRLYNAMVIQSIQKNANEFIPAQFRRAFLTGVIMDFATHSGIQTRSSREDELPEHMLAATNYDEQQATEAE